MYTYDANGNQETVTYPNGTIAEYTYDEQNRLVYLENRKSTGEVISSYFYTLDPAGNRTRATENTGRIVNYDYDSVYKLTQETITDPVNGNEAIAYTYDPAGNRLTKTDSAGTITYTYDANDRLLTESGPAGSFTYSYDANGNTTSKSGNSESITYSYDYENRLLGVDTPVSEIAYAYDADGIRVRQSVDGTTTDFIVDKNRDYAQVLEERDNLGSLTASYVYGADLILQDRGGAESYYHYDGLGSTRALSNNAASMTDAYTYEAFGNLTHSSGTTQNNYRFTGEQYDPNAGFYYLRARYYNPEIGRFVTVDPYEGDTNEPATLHKYIYAGMNPVMFVDPNGEMITAQEAMIGLAILSTLTVSYCIATNSNPVEMLTSAKRAFVQSLANNLIVLVMVDNFVSGNTRLMGKIQDNEFSRKAKEIARDRGITPCEAIQQLRGELNREYNGQIPKDIKAKVDQAEKFLGCRNKSKR